MSIHSKKSIPPAGRRAFLRTALTASVGLTAVAIASGGVAATAEEEQATPDEPKKRKQGYRVTQHVLDYYKSAS